MFSQGFDNLSNQLTSLADNVRKLQETKLVSITDILTPQFISERTRFQNLSDFFEASGFDIQRGGSMALHSISRKIVETLAWWMGVGCTT